MSKQEREANNEQKKQDMLEYIQKTYDEVFEVIEFTPAARGFNDSNNQTILTVKRPGTNMVVNVREWVKAPGAYADDYRNALVSWELGRDLIDYSGVSNLMFSKTYVAVEPETKDTMLVGENIKELLTEELREKLLEPEHVDQVTVVMCIEGKVTDEAVDELYNLYQQMQSLGYRSIFLKVGFTDGNPSFERYVNNFNVYGTRALTSWGFGEVYREFITKGNAIPEEYFISEIKNTSKRTIIVE